MDDGAVEMLFLVGQSSRPPTFSLQRSIEQRCHLHPTSHTPLSTRKHGRGNVLCESEHVRGCNIATIADCIFHNTECDQRLRRRRGTRLPQCAAHEPELRQPDPMREHRRYVDLGQHDMEDMDMAKNLEQTSSCNSDLRMATISPPSLPIHPHPPSPTRRSTSSSPSSAMSKRKQQAAWRSSWNI